MINKKEIVKIIEESVTRSPYNNFSSMNLPGEPMWEKPLVGFAAGDDPYFKKFRDDIGDFYWLPNEAYKLKFKNSEATDDKLTVISIGFPQTEKTKSDQKNLE